MILDVCCGSRMFWFNRQNEQVIYMDKRRERHELKDKSSKGGSRSLVIEPDIQGDFTSIPFKNDLFSMVVFDPPHLFRNGAHGWMAKKYGKLFPGWQDEFKAGFTECFRVLRPGCFLVFKWNEHEIPVSQILKLAPCEPLFGNRCGRNAKTHWLVFMKTV